MTQEQNNIFENEVVIEDSTALLRTFKESDIPSLLPIAMETGLWEFVPYTVKDEITYRKVVSNFMDEFKAKTRLPFLIVDKKSGRSAGSTSFLNIAFADNRVEIGSTWLGADFRSTGLNMHCKKLLIDFAFDKLDVIRVEFKTDFLNERSRAALKKIGAFEEGVLRSHMNISTGRRRDSIYYSILKNEWEFVKENYFKDIN